MCSYYVRLYHAIVSCHCALNYTSLYSTDGLPRTDSLPTKLLSHSTHASHTYDSLFNALSLTNHKQKVQTIPALVKSTRRCYVILLCSPRDAAVSLTVAPLLQPVDPRSPPILGMVTTGLLEPSIRLTTRRAFDPSLVALPLA